MLLKVLEKLTSSTLRVLDGETTPRLLCSPIPASFPGQADANLIFYQQHEMISITGRQKQVKEVSVRVVWMEPSSFEAGAP